MRITSLLLLAASSAFAQDTRTVVEPKFPAACTTLAADLIPDADTTLFAADEAKYDTQRIQRKLENTLKFLKQKLTLDSQHPLRGKMESRRML